MTRRPGFSCLSICTSCSDSHHQCQMFWKLQGRGEGREPAEEVGACSGLELGQELCSQGLSGAQPGWVNSLGLILLLKSSAPAAKQ